MIRVYVRIPYQKDVSAATVQKADRPCGVCYSLAVLLSVRLSICLFICTVRRLLLEVMASVANAIGADRCGVRLSPYNTFLDAKDTVDRAIEKNVWLMKEMDSRVPGLAYIHMVSVTVSHVFQLAAVQRFGESLKKTSDIRPEA